MEVHPHVHTVRYVKNYFICIHTCIGGAITSNENDDLGAILGGVIGGFGALILLIITVISLCYFKYWRSKN